MKKKIVKFSTEQLREQIISLIEPEQLTDTKLQQIDEIINNYQYKPPLELNQIAYAIENNRMQQVKVTQVRLTRQGWKFKTNLTYTKAWLKHGVNIHENSTVIESQIVVNTLQNL